MCVDITIFAPVGVAVHLTESVHLYIPLDWDCVFTDVRIPGRLPRDNPSDNIYEDNCSKW